MEVQMNFFEQNDKQVCAVIQDTIMDNNGISGIIPFFRHWGISD